jgi:long-chain acyl-CoA synthetase
MRTKGEQANKQFKGVPFKIDEYQKPLFSLLDEATKLYPQNIFTIFQGGTRTYAQVKTTSEKIAGFLVDQGIKKGDKVAIFLPNIPQFPEIFFGILKAGAICVTCNPLYTGAELNFQLKDCGAKIVFCMDHPTFYPTTVQAIKNTNVETVVICGVKSYLPKIKGFMGGLLGKIPKAEKYEKGHLFFDDVIKKSAPLKKSPDIDPDKDLALLLYTSGTTGRPKGACLSHANMAFAVKYLHGWSKIKHEPGGGLEPLRPDGSHCFLGILPWYHIFGLWASMLWCCMTGNKMVCIPDPRSGNPPFLDALESIEKYKVTMLTAVPTIYTAITNHPLIDQFDVSSIVCCASGAAPLAKETLARFEKKTGAVIFEGYGMSECLPIAINPTNAEDRKIGSVGIPNVHSTIKILDIETGLTEVPEGDEGEIAAHGPVVMQGYYNRPDANESDFREVDGKRFLLTGDIGRIDEEGFLIITDRKKDMILVGGFNVYPAEVENTIISHPKVAIAAVIGVKDQNKGEKVKAYVQLSPGETSTVDEIKLYCRENLSGYKCPAEVEFREALPTSIVGKVIRRVLKEEEQAK